MSSEGNDFQFLMDLYHLVSESLGNDNDIFGDENDEV